MVMKLLDTNVHTKKGVHEQAHKTNSDTLKIVTVPRIVIAITSTYPLGQDFYNDRQWDMDVTDMNVRADIKVCS